MPLLHPEIDVSEFQIPFLQNPIFLKNWKNICILISHLINPFSPSVTFLLHILFLTGVGERLSSYAPFFIVLFLNVKKGEQQPFEPIWDITLFSSLLIFCQTVSLGTDLFQSPYGHITSLWALKGYWIKSWLQCTWNHWFCESQDFTHFP